MSTAPLLRRSELIKIRRGVRRAFFAMAMKSFEVSKALQPETEILRVRDSQTYLETW